MSDSKLKDLMGESIDSSLDEPVIRGGTVDFSVDDGFANAVQNEGGRRISGSTMLLAGVIVASVVGLWSMRFLGQSNAAGLDIDRQLEVGKWVMDAEKDGAVVGLSDLQILGRLDKSRLNDLQIPVKDLRNAEPFRYYGELYEETVVKTEGPRTAAPSIDDLKDRFDAIIDEIGWEMQVTAILAPDTPRAQTVLNGHRLMVGDVFDVPFKGREYEFEVERIGRDGVVFVSRMSQPRHERRIEVPVRRNF